MLDVLSKEPWFVELGALWPSNAKKEKIEVRRQIGGSLGAAQPPAGAEAYFIRVQERVADNTDPHESWHMS